MQVADCASPAKTGRAIWSTITAAAVARAATQICRHWRLDQPHGAKSNLLDLATARLPPVVPAPLPQYVQLLIQGHPEGNLMVDLPPDALVAEVHQHIRSAVGTPENAQRLVFDGVPLQPDMSLRNSGIRQNSVLGLTVLPTQSPCPSAAAHQALPSLSLLIRVLNGSTLSLAVPCDALVSQLMVAIHDREGIPAEHQRLLHHGKQLRPDACLADLGLENGTEITVMLGLRGGRNTCGRKTKAMGTLPSPSLRVAAPRPTLRHQLCLRSSYLHQDKKDATLPPSPTAMISTGTLDNASLLGPEGATSNFYRQRCESPLPRGTGHCSSLEEDFM